MHAKPQEITNFLYKFKFFASSGGFTHIERERNRNTLTLLGIVYEQIENVILGLTYRDYFKGPEPDKDNPGYNVWAFGRNVAEKEIYIKLSDDFRHKLAKCISFHVPEYEIIYPYRGRR